jgi:hypothetical protein
MNAWRTGLAPEADSGPAYPRAAIFPGRGAEMRRDLGLAVFSGMLGVTFFGIFLTPVFFYLLRRHGDRAQGAAKPKE